MPSNTDSSLKNRALVVLGGIGALALYPYASRSTYRLEEPALYIAIGCLIAIVLVIFSDRLTSLKLTQNSFELQLKGIKEELEDTIGEVKQVLPSGDPRILEAEKLVSKSSVHDLREEARDIASAMKLLREIMREYKRNDF